MNWRWWALWAVVGALAGGGRAAGGEDDVPDTLDDDDDTELALHREESRNVQPRAYQQQTAGYNTLPSGFRPGSSPSLAELAGYSRPQPLLQHPRQGGENRIVRPSAAQRAHTEQAERDRGERGPGGEGEPGEEEEREEPDRLAQLLQQSRFDCQAKQTGYYADQELACEVFHYCQDGVKHSWICPDGFTFHQVHLICMPPTHDSICQQSAKYHFVNEYLYRPLNTEEVARKPSTPLRYSERYYPAEVYHDERQDLDDEDDEEQQEGGRSTIRPPPSPAPGSAQVFRSAEEVNIPLLQRRPPPHAPHALHRPSQFHF